MTLTLAMDFPPGIHALLAVHRIHSAIGITGPYQYTDVDVEEPCVLDDSRQDVQK
jgi:hypothetical protein